MDAIKRERDFSKAAGLFREALALNPEHEDSHYYLASCLAALGDIPAAIAELDALTRINPQNHRAFQRKGELLAASASSRSDPAEFGGDRNSGVTRRSVTCHERLRLSRPRFHARLPDESGGRRRRYFRGFIAWKREDSWQALASLNAARHARGPDWKPSGSVLEGDVQRRMYSESGFLNAFERQWDGLQIQLGRTLLRCIPAPSAATGTSGCQTQQGSSASESRVSAVPRGPCKSLRRGFKSLATLSPLDSLPPTASNFSFFLRQSFVSPPKARTATAAASWE